MRHAEWIANRLLEAVPNEPKRSLPGAARPLAKRGAAYVFAGGTAKAYASLEQYAQAEGAKTEEQVSPTIDAAIQRGAVILEQPDYGRLIVYAKDYPVPVGTKELSLMQHQFNVLGVRNVAFARSTQSGYEAVPFSQIFAGQKVVDQRRKEQERLGKQAEKAEKEQVKYQKQQQAQQPETPQQVRRGIETERGRWFNPPGWREEFKKEYGVDPESLQTGYTERGGPEPEQENPFTLGIDFDQRYRRRGVLIGGIDPNGPAASSVLKAGDIIRAVGPFETRSGNIVGPYRIDRPRDLQRTLSWMRGGTAFPMKVVRGSNYVDAVVMPTPKKANAPTA